MLIARSAVAVSFVAGCALTTDLSDLRGGSSPNDAGGDGGNGGDGGTSGNLVGNSSFETGAGGCGPGWSGYAQTLTFSTTARTGARSCDVCQQGAVSSYALEEDSIQLAAGNYYAEAWIETPSTSDAVLSGVVVYFTPQGGSQTSFQGGQVTAGTSWTQSQLQFTVDKPGTASIQVHVFSPPATGSCILVDDVSLLPQ
jgi:hypothetical protein